jgi:serine/threonine-protein kinase 11
MPAICVADRIGAYGKVREGLEVSDKRHVAIKIIEKRTLKRIPKGEEQVREEIAVLKYLKEHPYERIIQFIEHFSNESDSKLYLVFEFVAGGHLQGLVERSPIKRIPNHQARDLFADLLDGLIHLQRSGVIHKGETLTLTLTLTRKLFLLCLLRNVR